ncbi:PREDICTED: nucleoside diphosphate-linked moiety X motif 13 isoform X2 [Elephantulus edwardii]|uniref:nucleoside diphosphate-linked moiety X motif 13 isoform X2 n=1 Tax=Elephantulus edwardii TaxID=28737 RepID=UPI0003F0C5C7|nr:PREDICTED: nucleoside diphosphate-linked moiety X motif 13 isoform X2 [Elephantulus edwardii]
MSLYCGIACRRKSFWCYRLLSTYISKTRYIFELKEDDDACKKAHRTGAFYLFHNLAPLLQKLEHQHQYLAPRHSFLELEKLLGKLGQDTQKIEDSVLIGCSGEHEAWFALDLGLNNPSSTNDSLQKLEMETELKGSFVELRKALLQLDVKDASLLSMAQALLRWHDTHQFCSRSGQPTKKNMAGSKRVCPSNNIIYYPQIQVNSRELEAASWFSHDEVATALRRKGPYSQQKDGSFPFWLPPRLAIAHRLIKEWLENHKCSSLPA